MAIQSGTASSGPTYETATPTTDRYWVRPPQNPGRATAATMKPIAPSEPDLGRYSGSMVIVTSIRCRRRGAYKTKGLADRFGPETFLTDVPQRVAESRGCSFARGDLLDPRPDGDRRCGAHLDVDGHWRLQNDDQS
jgi:hypothetical protein